MATQQLLQQLDALESELTRINLWRESQPSEEQLSSQEPFCVDTMAFEQWLQWIFIPKMRELLNMPHFNGMAHSSDIHTMADYVFKAYPEDTDNAVKIILTIDKLINNFEQNTLQ